MVVIGAGGAGKALAYGAKEKGAKVVIANRTYGKIHMIFFSFMNTFKYSITSHSHMTHSHVKHWPWPAKILRFFNIG